MQDKEKKMKIWSELVAKAWSDPKFKQKLLSNPKACFAEKGMQITTDVKIHEETAHCLHLVLPMKPENLEEQDWQKASGGLTCTCGVAPP